MIEMKDLEHREELSPQQAETLRGGSQPVPGPVGHLVKAFEVGYKLGTALDEATGLSDWIAGTDDYPIITDKVKNAGNPQ